MYNRDRDGWSRDWETDNIPDEYFYSQECLNWPCDHPSCPDHNGSPSLFEDEYVMQPMMTRDEHWQVLIEDSRCS